MTEDLSMLDLSHLKVETEYKNNEGFTVKKDPKEVQRELVERHNDLIDYLEKRLS